MPKTRPAHAAEFRQQMVDLVRAGRDLRAGRGTGDLERLVDSAGPRVGDRLL
ncbi:MAG: hypothetical protein OXG72_18400 [Acidobacteria bacterium]|nr:hypothetical protein [Acidobacteriota bacterium]